MIWRDVTFQQFKEESGQKKIICVGYGQLFQDMTALWAQEELQRIVLIADNNKFNHKLVLCDKSFTVIPVEKLPEYDMEDTCILITSLYCKSLYEQLEILLENRDICCYIYPTMSLKVLEYDLLLQNGKHKIPKKIHYFWFGKGELPEENKKCIESWKKYCPDYEIIKWTEENYDITKCSYMHQAYKNKKWGFVPDYARLDTLYQYGGIYLDTDVELIKGLDDLLSEDAFIGFQRNFWVNIGLGCGCKKGLDIFREMRDLYDRTDFVRKGEFNLQASPYYQTKILKKHGLVCNNQLQKIEGVSILPTDVLDPQGYSFGKISVTKNTHSIHHYSESWLNDIQRNQNLTRYMEVNFFR